MSIRSLVSATNILFLIGGIYFAVLAGLHESSPYSLVPAVICFVAFALGFRSEWILSAPWRTATAVLVIVLSIVQIGTNYSVETASDYYTIGSTLINGILFVLFLGALLSSLKSSVTRETEEKEEGKTRTPSKQTSSQK